MHVKPISIIMVEVARRIALQQPIGWAAASAKASRQVLGHRLKRAETDADTFHTMPVT